MYLDLVAALATKMAASHIVFTFSAHRHLIRWGGGGQERDEARAALEASAVAAPQANGKRAADEEQDASAAKKVWRSARTLQSFSYRVNDPVPPGSACLARSGHACHAATPCHVMPLLHASGRQTQRHRGRSWGRARIVSGVHMQTARISGIRSFVQSSQYLASWSSAAWETPG